MRRLYYFNAIGIILLYLAIPKFLNIFMMNSTWNTSEWASFLGSYLGGGIGGILALVGIWWQLRRNDKKEERDKLVGILKYFDHILEENLNIEYEWLYVVYSYTVKNWWTNNYQNFSEFNYKILENSFKEIFELEFGKDILNLSKKIKEYNENYNFLKRNLTNKDKFLEELKKELLGKKEYLKEENTKLEYVINLIELLELLSQALFNQIKDGDCSYFQRDIFLKLEDLKKNNLLFNEEFQGKIKSVFRENDIFTENNFKNIQILSEGVCQLSGDIFWELKTNKYFLNTLKLNIEELEQYNQVENNLRKINIEDIYFNIRSLKEKIIKEINKF